VSTDGIVLGCDDDVVSGQDAAAGQRDLERSDAEERPMGRRGRRSGSARCAPFVSPNARATSV
jgi:hypothetical protein